MTAETLEHWIAEQPEDQRPRDGQQLARDLVRQKKLTKYQCDQILAGRGRSLTLGNYVVLDKLGEGGMGVVLKAKHKRMKRQVALKVMSAAGLQSTDTMRRFHREVEAAARLSHPNIVTAFDADEADGTHFLVMEYVDGLNLTNWVKRNGPMPVDQAVPCMIQTAIGLKYAHEHGVIHRDIKPSNLLIQAIEEQTTGLSGSSILTSNVLRSGGTIRILDMGLARLEENPGATLEYDGRLTVTGTMMGTVNYMSPEQAADGGNADARSDIYSLGCTLYYMLTGKIMYDEGSVVERLSAHQSAPLPSLMQVVPQAFQAWHGIGNAISEERLRTLNAVFQRMVAKQPQDRQQSMSEVITDLERCLPSDSQTPAEAAVSNPPPPTGMETLAEVPSGGFIDPCEFSAQTCVANPPRATEVCEPSTRIIVADITANTVAYSVESQNELRVESQIVSSPDVTAIPEPVSPVRDSESLSIKNSRQVLWISGAAVVVILLAIVMAQLWG